MSVLVLELGQALGVDLRLHHEGGCYWVNGGPITLCADGLADLSRIALALEQEMRTRESYTPPPCREIFEDEPSEHVQLEASGFREGE